MEYVNKGILRDEAVHPRFFKFKGTHYQQFQLMGAKFFTSHWDFQMMGTNYLLNIVVNKNWWEQLDLS